MANDFILKVLSDRDMKIKESETWILNFYRFSAATEIVNDRHQTAAASNSELISEYDESNSGCHWGNWIADQDQHEWFGKW